MDNGIGGTRLRRSIDRHPHKHSSPDIGDAEREGQKDWKKDGSLDRGSSRCAREETP